MDARQALAARPDLAEVAPAPRPRRRGWLHLLLGPALFVALGAALGLGLDRLGTSAAPPYPDEAARFERLFARADQIRVLAIGNSHSLAVDFHALGIPDAGYHVWHPGQDLFEVESQMETLLPRLPAVDTVLFAVSFASFHRDNAAATIADREGVRRKFYSMPPRYRPIPGDWTSWLQGRMSSLVREDHWRSVIAALARPAPPPGSPPPRIRNLDDTGLIDLRRKDTEQDDEGMTRTSVEITAPRHVNLQRDMVAQNGSLPGSAVASLERTLRLLAGRGIRVICFTAPVYEAYTAAYDQPTVAFMRDTMARLAAEHGIEYHDFSGDRQFCGVAALFSNPDHLNVLGARRFSEHRLKPILERRP